MHALHFFLMDRCNNHVYKGMHTVLQWKLLVVIEFGSNYKQLIIISEFVLFFISHADYLLIDIFK